ncbi:MAG: M20 family peptidase [Candidatus Binatia bacterium]
MKRIAVALALAAVVVAGVVVWRALNVHSRQIDVAPAQPLTVDVERAAAGLAEAVRFETISHQDPAAFDAAPFVGLRRFLEARFPRVHAALRRETVNDHSLLYAWPGTTDGAPILLLAHLDVVPVEAGSEAGWVQPPFGGIIADGYIWGRGTLDDKGSALAILEAAELLLAAGVQPPRTLYFAFGHDEEVSGHQGAKAIAALLAERGIAPALVLDEGGAILEGLVPGVDAPVASIGMAEKGYVSVELVVHGAGGHSSIPPRHTAIGVLSAAIERLEDDQMPANLNAAMGKSFDFLGPEMDFAPRLVLANLWLFGPLVEWQMSASAQTNAPIRTTTAVTVFQSGVKDNVLPSSARAVVNFRILPGDTVASVLEHVRRTADDPAVQISVLGEGNDPSPVSDVDSAAFEHVARTVRATFPGVLVTPFLVLGATDARHYTALSPHIFRFAPSRMRPEDLARVHGTNERIGVQGYADMIRFYAELMRAPFPRLATADAR